MEPGLEDHAGTYFAVGVYWIQNGPDFSGSGAVHGSAYINGEEWSGRFTGEC